MNAADLTRFAEKSKQAAALTQRANDLAHALDTWPDAITIRLTIKPGYNRGINIEKDTRSLATREEWADVDVTDRLARALFDCLGEMARETHAQLTALFAPDPVVTPAPPDPPLAPFVADPFHVAPDRIDQRPAFPDEAAP